MADEIGLYPLRIFQMVARLGSVTQAAEALGISQPAVSAHLRALENRYDEPLFERTPRGMRLTPIGEVLAGYTNRLFAHLEDMQTAIAMTRGQARGEVTIAASTTPAAYLLPGCLRQFRERCPEAEPTLLVGDSREVLDWLSDYRAQIGVVGELKMAEGLTRQKLAVDELRLMTAREDRLSEVEAVTPAHLAERVLFLRERGSSTRAGAEALLGERIGLFRRVQTLSSSEVIKQAVMAGLGVAVLSSWATQLEEEAGRLRPLRDPSLRLERNFYLIRRADRTLIGAAAALWEFLTLSATAFGTTATERLEARN
jgi:molybdate transport repressor ModE-like protein